MSIVALVKETRERIQEYDERQRAKDEFERVKQTHEALTRLNNIVSQLQEGLQLLRTYLLPKDISDVAGIVQKSLWLVKRSEEQFLVHSLQTAELQPVQNYLREAQDTLKGGWEAYVKRSLRDPQKLYRQVASLPGVKENRDAYEDIRRRLGEAQRNLPTTQRQLDDFARTLEQFKRMLQEVGVLSEAVQVFLEKVAQGTATIEDVDDEVLQWCHQESQRSKAFSIKFA